MSTLPPPKSHPVSWLFVDVGGVLLDDTPLLESLYRYITDALVARGVKVTLDAILAERERLIAAGVPGVYKSVLRKFAPNDETCRNVLSEFRAWLEPRQKELNPVLPGVHDALAKLAFHYKLALAANQGAYLRNLLEGLGLLRFFSFSTLSGDIGLSKPDPRFFEQMLADTGATCEKSVMIGDSLVNDLRPAHAFGFRTIRVIAGGDNVREASAYSFVDGTVASLQELPGLLAEWNTGAV
jgi:HAD superfamily hydrolase (TIGR01549 family)